MPSKSTKAKASNSSSCRKVNSKSIPKAKLLAVSRSAQSYFVVDTTLPSHIVTNRSLFTTYAAGRKVYCTALGHDIIIEGTGDVLIRVFVAGQYICFHMRNCWHVPSSAHHFLSCVTVTSLGHQVMIAGRSPRMIYSHQRRLVAPNLPKYLPFTHVDGLIVLKFEIPAAVFITPQSPESSQPVQPTTQLEPIAQPVFSLQASRYNHNCLFAGLAFNQSLLPLPFSSSSESSALATIDFKSKPEATVISALGANFNTLLDSGCVHHIIRDRSLFSNFVSKTTSVGTATFGSLEALGSGDVDFRYPYADHHVTFTLRGCLFAPTAPINLLSVNVLVEHRGMSCIFSPAGITKVFFHADHLKLPGLVFRPNITNHLSFLTLVFIPPASSIPNPSVFPVPSCPISFKLPPTITVDSSTSSRLPHTIISQVCTTAGQAHDLIRLPDFCSAEYLGGAVTIVDIVENRGAVVAGDVVAGIGDVVGVLNGGAELEDPSADVVLHGVQVAVSWGTLVCTDACFPLDDDAIITSHGGADALLSFHIPSSSYGFRATFPNASNSEDKLEVEDNFLVHLSTPSFSRTSSLSRSFSSILNVNPYSPLSFSHNKFSFSSPFSTLTLFESSFPTSVQQLPVYCPISINSAVTRHGALRLSEMSRRSRPIWPSAEFI
jgi:hypothetical protein